MRDPNRQTATKLARQLWGEVQHCHKLAPGVWEFTTASHGGIIVDNKLYPSTKKWNVWVETRKGSDWGYANEQHFSAFEEDADWAIAEYLLADVIDYEKMYREYKKFGEKSSYPIWLGRRRSGMMETLRTYHKDFCREQEIEL